MADTLYQQIRKRFVWSAVGLATVLATGTIGYWLISGKQISFVDGFYMTFITIATIGFGEIVDLSGHPVGRMFTVFISLAGIGLMTYILLNITTFVVEGHVNEAFRRRRMEKTIETFKNHFIICGMEGASFYVFDELRATGRPYVIIESDTAKVEKLEGNYQECVFIKGDPTDDATLERAGIERAHGLFAVTADDNLNLVITLTAKQLNPHVRIVAGCQEIKNTRKMKKAGADSVISPTYIGGLRMASEMIRPTVVTFLDVMMSRKDQNLRIEEVAVPPSYSDKPLSSLNLKKYKHLLLLAVRTAEGWTYNPSREYVMKQGERLVFMSTPDERQELEIVFSDAT